MEKKKCLMCNSDATRKLSVEPDLGHFYLCEKDVCEYVLLSQIKGASKNQN
jgi:hypothetical protein